MANFSSHFTSEDSKMSHHMLRPTDLRGSSIDPLGRDVVPMRSRAYGLDDITSYVPRSEPGIDGMAGRMSVRGYPSSLEDPILMSQRPVVPLGISSVAPGNPDMIYETPGSQRRVDGLPLHEKESNVLFIGGLPTDCTRREVGHIFRPFIGFKDIKVVHKEPRRSGEKAMVLCFVEFNDSKCALTAMNALQGYKFDDKKPDSSVLKIHFAHFPFRLPSET